jgi:hypothetical protein
VVDEAREDLIKIRDGMELAIAKITDYKKRKLCEPK